MRRKNRTFRTKLYSIFLYSIMLPLLIAVVVFLVYYARAILDREEENAQSILNSVEQNIELQLAEVEELRMAYYIHSEVQREAERLNSPELYANYTELEKNEMEDAYTMTLAKMIYTSSQNIRTVVFFPASGGDTAYYLGKDRMELREIGYSSYDDEPWFRKALEDPQGTVYCGPHLPDYIENRRLGQVYSCVGAIRDRDLHKVIGVVKIDVDMDGIQSAMETLVDTATNGLMLLKDGAVFARSREPEGEPRRSKDGRMMINSDVYRITARAIPDTDLELVYLVQQNSLFSGYFYIILLALLLMLFGVLLSFANFRHRSRKMIEDVRQIATVIQGVEKGKLDTHIELEEDSVFFVIADAVNRMIDNLKEYIEKEYVLTIRHQKAQYQALQSQINPHFLYNTLNGFIALNRMGEKQLLEKSIIRLSRLFQYSCGSEETTSVASEMGFLEDYLKLEKLKYEERLEYLLWIGDGCRNMRIPKLLLQPIVENSIKHGMGDTDRPVMIQITALHLPVRGLGMALVITVRDNGVGFCMSRAEAPGRHVGLDNTRRRAELFDRNAVFQCRSGPGKGTRVTFVFFDRKEGEEDDHSDRG